MFDEISKDLPEQSEQVEEQVVELQELSSQNLTVVYKDGLFLYENNEGG